MKINGKLLKVGMTNTSLYKQKSCTLTVNSDSINIAMDGFLNHSQATVKSWSLQAQFLYDATTFLQLYNRLISYSDNCAPITFSFPTGSTGSTTKTITGNAFITRLNLQAQGKGIPIVNLTLTGQGALSFPT